MSKIKVPDGRGRGQSMKNLFRFERRHEPLASPRHFSSRLLRNGIWALGIVIAALAVGMAGYMYFEEMSFEDAFVNAAMILSGMGTMKTALNTATKYFAGIYAIISGLLIFGIAGLVLAPVYHRLLHRFHVEDEEQGK